MIIAAKLLGKKKPPVDDWNYEPPQEILEPGDGGLTLRELLTRIVRDEVQAYNTRQKKQQFTTVLTARKIESAARVGKISMGGLEETQLADADESVGNALQSFEDGLFMVFLDGAEQPDLDAQVFVTPESKLTFIKLTFLAGA